MNTSTCVEGECVATHTTQSSSRNDDICVHTSDSFAIDRIIMKIDDDGLRDEPLVTCREQAVTRSRTSSQNSSKNSCSPSNADCIGDGESKDTSFQIHDCDAIEGISNSEAKDAQDFDNDSGNEKRRARKKAKLAVNPKEGESWINTESSRADRPHAETHGPDESAVKVRRGQSKQRLSGFDKHKDAGSEESKECISNSVPPKVKMRDKMRSRNSTSGKSSGKAGKTGKRTALMPDPSLVLQGNLGKRRIKPKSSIQDGNACNETRVQKFDSGKSPKKEKKKALARGPSFKPKRNRNSNTSARVNRRVSPSSSAKSPVVASKILSDDSDSSSDLCDESQSEQDEEESDASCDDEVVDQDVSCTKTCSSTAAKFVKARLGSISCSTSDLYSQDLLQAACQTLRGYTTGSPENAAIFVLSDEKKRTPALLIAISRGIPVVSTAFVSRSIESGRWLAWHQFECHPGAKQSRLMKVRKISLLVSSLLQSRCVCCAWQATCKSGSEDIFCHNDCD